MSNLPAIGNLTVNLMNTINQEHQLPDVVQAKNAIVRKAYYAIITEIKQLLKHYPTEQLRTYIEATGYCLIGCGEHSLYSPLLHISLGELNDELIISFAKNLEVKSYVGFRLDNTLIRCIYKYTDAGATDINIEDCVEEYEYGYRNYQLAKQYCDEDTGNYQMVTVESLLNEA